MNNLHIDIFQIISGEGHKNDPCITHAISARYRRGVKTLFPWAIVHIGMGTAPRSNDLSINVSGGGYGPEKLIALRTWVQWHLMSLMAEAAQTERSTAVTQCLGAIHQQLLTEANRKFSGRVK